MSIVSESIWAAAPTTTRGQPTQLSTDSKGERLAYASGKSVFVRNIDNPGVSKQYTSHVAQTTVARFAPSGFYVASGDVSGTVRVWDCVGEGATKGEYHIIAGPINDIAWDGDSQRIIAVGNGKERYGHCITADSGNSVGEISGHSSSINSVSIRQQRPLRAMTGSDDTNLVFYHGAPFKFQTSLRNQHNKFVLGCGFSPDGANIVTVGADRRIWLYDGKSGESKTQIGEGVHTGSIFAVSWAQDSKRLVTASADQTIRIWDVEAGKAVQTWRMGEEGIPNVPDQQVGVAWPHGRSDGLIISCDLDGNLNYLVEGNPKPSKVVTGHQKNITSSVLSDQTFYTGSFDGRVRAWDIATGLAEKIDGNGPSNYIAGMSAVPLDASKEPGSIYVASWDDTLRSISAKTFTGSTSSLGSQPKALSVTIAAPSGPIVLVATSDSLDLYSSGQKIASHSVPFTPTALAAHASTIAIGADDKSLRLYTLASTDLTPISAEPRKPTAPISTLSFSPSGSLLAAGTTGGKIMVYDTSNWSVKTDRWSAHTARITSIAWNSDSSCAVSGSLDTNVMVWSLQDPGKRIKALNAHKDGVNGVAWVEGTSKVLSTGGDATVKAWTVDGVS
ncbi:WD40 repeat-like protein [Eremomyces bilateralis CBS 781.70]|uniref:WD40 repeat-like protein n=1 Tax=Eremomyces bilateralis CBS 781.70 TaxID=1392243 RepID=A0A6G1FTX0_9PEZI|nr:WD40 repeat-like protein [Eremomyces bilateralis CBS 781.70]KAF1809335.1 WD40 repeat-like protein [Eremomyces bilateralis CBS 781.70]